MNIARLVKKFSSAEIVRNISILFFGTILAQLIPFLASFVLARLYTPDAFGVFSVFLSLSLIFASFSTGKYELAIMLPKQKNKAFYLFVLTVVFSLALNALFFMALIVFGEQIASWIKFSGHIQYLYLCPILAFATAIYTSSQYFLNRKKQYKKITKNKMVQSSFVTIFQLGFYKISAMLGLIWGYLLGSILAVINLLRGSFEEEKKYLKGLNFKKLKTVGLEYKKFPIFFSFSYGLNTFVNNIVPVILTASFGLKYAGFYVLVQRVFGMPSSMIVSSISGVFFQKATTQQDCRKLYLAISFSLFLVGAPFVLLFYYYAAELFQYMFGEEWVVSGKIASILVFMYWLSISTNSVAQFSTIHQKVVYNISWQVALLGGVILAWYLGNAYQDVFVYFKVFAIVQCLLYVIGYCYEYYLCLKQAKGSKV